MQGSRKESGDASASSCGDRPSSIDDIGLPARTTTSTRTAHNYSKYPVIEINLSETTHTLSTFRQSRLQRHHDSSSSNEGASSDSDCHKIRPGAVREPGYLAAHTDNDEDAFTILNDLATDVDTVHQYFMEPSQSSVKLYPNILVW